MFADDDPGLWCELAGGDFAGRAGLFLDRDGVLIEDTGYVGRAEEVRMIAGAAQAVARCNRCGIPVVVVSNQSGIGRGFYGWDGFHAVQAALAAELAAAGARWDAVLACAHHAAGMPPYNHARHPWRKPNAGMLVAAGERLRLDLARSWLVGDRGSDIAAARAAQLAGGVLISADDRERDAAAALAMPGFAVANAASLAEAVTMLLAAAHLRA